MHIEFIPTPLNDDPDFSFQEEKNGKMQIATEGEKVVFHFDREERDRLTEALNKFDETERKAFINDLAEICYKRKYLDGPGITSERQAAAQAVYRHLNKALEDLSLIRFGYLADEVPLRQMTSMNNSGEWSPAIDIENLAKESAPLIKKLATLLDIYLPAGKRGVSAIDTTDFCESVARLYIQSFQKKPSTYKMGPFYKVFCVACDISGCSSTDPSKTISKVVRKLKEENI